MKKTKLLSLLTFLLFLSLSGCQKTPEKKTPSSALPTPPSDTRNTPETITEEIFWDAKFLPLEIRYADNLTPTEQKAVKEAFSLWREEIGENTEKTVARIQGETPAFESEYLEDFTDNTIGIYFFKDLFPSQNKNALAITRYEGYIRYKSKTEAIITLDHADIFVNGFTFNFTDKSTEEGEEDLSSFDFKSVLLHEMGHLLGLSHSVKNDSVMRPSITIQTVFSTLSQEDKDLIQEKYPRNSAQENMAAFSDKGQRIEIIIELKKNGEEETYFSFLGGAKEKTSSDSKISFSRLMSSRG